MKKTFLPWRALIIVSAGIFIVACEKHKDPFSANNVKPAIADFRFKSDNVLPNGRTDSLKFKIGASYKLYLQYDDREFSNSTTRKLKATFSFESGSGKISNDQFGEASGGGLTFEGAPGKFDGDLLFVPEAPGVVRVKLQLSDGVKTSDLLQASTTFFENLKPAPAFTYRLLTQTNPYRVEFNPAPSQDRDGDIKKAQFVWSFGDGSPNSVIVGPSIVTHDYNNAGEYRVRLRILDSDGATSKADSTEQFVPTANQPPQAALKISPTTSGKVDFNIDYTAEGSFDPDGMISSFKVLFGDGDTSQEKAGKHTFKVDGNYRVTVIVKDNFGLADTAVVSVQVVTPPEAVLKIDPAAGGKIPLSLMVSGKDSRDPHPGGRLTSYNITITNATTNTLFGTFPQDSVTVLLQTPANYRITLDVTNNRGLSNRVEKVIPAGLPGSIDRGEAQTVPAFRRP